MVLCYRNTSMAFQLSYESKWETVLIEALMMTWIAPMRSPLFSSNNAFSTWWLAMNQIPEC